jgi:3-methylfumaryl-CoA hydratase
MDDLTIPVDCVGRSEEASETAEPEPLRRLAALLEAGWPIAPGEAVPQGWHWVYFLASTPQSGLGSEGHASDDGLLPALPGLRRMWAGSRFVFDGSLRIGEPLLRRSRIVAAEGKRGRSGPFILIRLEHSIEGEGGLVREGQDLVFRPPAEGGEMARLRGQAGTSGGAGRADFERALTPDPVLLFRFSAVTFNAHRIHYDLPYATRVEGYPDLVVHGPLQALLMLDLLRRARPERHVANFSFRAESPAFLPAPLRIAGRETAAGFELWIESDGRVTGRASAEAAS